MGPLYHRAQSLPTAIKPGVGVEIGHSLAKPLRQLARTASVTSINFFLGYGDIGEIAMTTAENDRLSERRKKFSASSGNFPIRLSLLLPAMICASGLTSSCAQEPKTQTEEKDTNTETQSAGWSRQSETLVATLKSGRYQISDEKVLAAMRDTPRHEFVPEDVRNLAYEDRPLPIGHGQTISQPYIVAFMTEQLEPEPEDRVLEVGTGSGYQAAVLSPLVKELYSIEIVEPLAKTAEETLDRLGYENVHVKAGDGYLGWPEHAPFDAIIVTCAPTDIPKPLIKQLKEGGRMIIPVGPDGGVQELYLLEKKNGKIARKAVLPVRFVPMTGEARQKR